MIGCFKKRVLKNLEHYKTLYPKVAAEMTEFQAFCFLYIPGYSSLYLKRDFRERIQRGEIREADLIRVKAMIEVVLKEAEKKGDKSE